MGSSQDGQMSDYVTIYKVLGQISDEACDLILDRLYDLGVEGVEVRGPWTEQELKGLGGDYYQLRDMPLATEIHAYIKQDVLNREIAAFREVLGDFSIREVEPEEKWMLAYQEYFRPFRVGRRFVIVPSWEEYQAAAGDLVLTIDPGAAFGTGTHPTTANVLALMEDLELEGKSIADIGAGSGILTKGALLLGGKDVLVLDVDPEALAVAKMNLAGEGRVRFLENDLLTGIDECFDCILANLVADLILRLATALSGHLKPQGTVLVSGILWERWAEVRTALLNAGLQEGPHREEDGWVAAVFRKELS